jgi:hypothetical protein
LILSALRIRANNGSANIAPVIKKPFHNPKIINFHCPPCHIPIVKNTIKVAASDGIILPVLTPKTLRMNLPNLPKIFESDSG